jgi:hypothetical protein
MSDASQSHTVPQLTVRDVLRLVWEANCYPCLGNGDDKIAQRLEDEALAKVDAAITSPDDPPEFSQWLSALRDPSLRNPERDRIMDAIYSLFDPETGHLISPPARSSASRAPRDIWRRK